MLVQFLEGTLLLALSVVSHGLMLALAMKCLKLRHDWHERSVAGITWLMCRLALWVICAHLLAIILWGQYYYWRGVMTDAEMGLYFSAVTYATIGYGDIVPPEAWRLLAAMEGLTGLLMSAWSGGFFFAVVSRVYFPPEHSD